MMEQNIVIKNVKKHYPEFELGPVSLQIPQGAIMGLIGENGAGKTTMIKLILNLIQRDGGEISVFGMDNKKDEIKIKEQIGVVLDESMFYDGLKAKNVSAMMKRIYHNWEEETFFRYLQRFDISFKKTIKEYSKGMKMKLSLAVALSHQAKLLILDEPTGGLDPVIRNEILDIFMEFIMKEENSILISSHITTDLEKICDYITFLNKGRIVLSENKDELLNEYGILKCGKEVISQIEKKDIIRSRKNQFGYELLVKNKKELTSKYRNFVIDSVNLEELMLFNVKGEKI